MVSLAASSHSMWGPTTSPRVLIASPTTAYAVHHVGVHALTHSMGVRPSSPPMGSLPTSSRPTLHPTTTSPHTIYSGLLMPSPTTPHHVGACASLHMGTTSLHPPWDSYITPLTPSCTPAVISLVVGALALTTSGVLRPSL